MRKIFFLFLLLGSWLHADAAIAFPFDVYSGLLQKYVDGAGRVDYAALKKNDGAQVDRLVTIVATTGPDLTPSLYRGRDAALAYYIAAYNILIWKNVIDGLPKLKRVDENQFIFFRQPKFKVNGRDADLDDLEKKIIRPRFKDARMHFALNCASGGCPILPRTAFIPARVQGQLEAETRRFINEKRNVDYDKVTKTVSLSKIFDWYKDDFVTSGATLIQYINKYRKEAIPADAKITFFEYDWRLNDKSLPTR